MARAKISEQQKLSSTIISMSAKATVTMKVT